MGEGSQMHGRADDEDEDEGSQLLWYDGLVLL